MSFDRFRYSIVFCFNLFWLNLENFFHLSQSEIYQPSLLNHWLTLKEHHLDNYLNLRN